MIRLLPVPRYLMQKHGQFNILQSTPIVLSDKCNSGDLESARLLQQEVENAAGFKLPISKSLNAPETSCIYLDKMEGESESYKLSIDSHNVQICGADGAGLFYGIQTLRQLIRTEGIELPCLTIEDAPHFAHRGFYHDITRGKVPTLETLKELVDKASFYKINQLQLYVEHSFAFAGHNEIWAGKDPLTAEEILILDEYCRRRHIELVPSLATFGHLYEALSSRSFSHLCELENSVGQPYSWVERMRHHTLDVTNPESFELVQDMLNQFIPLFSSNKFNICCDETYDLGTGKSKALADELGKGQIYVDFLIKIICAVKKHDKQVMFWGDIILEHPELLGRIPEDVVCLNWSYGADVKEDNTRTIARSGLQQYVCPGVWGWNRLMNDFDVADANICKMISYGKKYGAVGVLNTDWGDYGHVNLFTNSIPGMILGAALSWNPDVELGEERLDDTISRLEFGDLAGTLMSLLRDLNRQQAMSWGRIIVWKEHKFKQSSFFIERSEFKESFLNLSSHDVIEKHQRTVDIGQRILRLGSLVQRVKLKDIDELYISAQGIALMNALVLIIKKYDLAQEVESLIYSSAELAEKLEYWLDDYSRVWRSRNKESELNRICETIQQICVFLRQCE